MCLKFSADCFISFSPAIFNFASSINVAELKRNVVEPEVESFSLPISQSDLDPAERHNIYVRFKRRPRPRVVFPPLPPPPSSTPDNDPRGSPCRWITLLSAFFEHRVPLRPRENTLTPTGT